MRNRATFTPKPEQMALCPDISGNTINGLDEDLPRPPRVVYWAPDPDTIAHGEMQRWFYTNDADNTHVNEARAEREKVLRAPIAPLAASRIDRAPAEWTAALQALTRQSDAFELTGVAAMRPDYLYEGAEVAESRIIVIGVAHDYKEIRHAPDGRAGAEVIRQYGRAGAAAKIVASWLREQGWEARPVTGPMAGDITMIPPAIDCGFGELGKHGSIINPQYGSSFRLAAVLTDAPFETTAKRHYGIDAFCSKCRVCEKACPTDAIFPQKQTVRGIRKWYVDFDKCLPFFNEHHGCAICIAVCPWSRPGIGPNLAAKLARRAKRLREAGG